MFRVLILVLAFLYFGRHKVEGFCETPPLGHFCRSIDLTGFCLQVSHFIRIRNQEVVKPYYNLERLFELLENRVHADKPFVHFGGYKKTNDKYHEDSCLSLADCIPANQISTTTAGPAVPTTPPPPTQAAGPGGQIIAATGAPAPSIVICRNIPCDGEDRQPGPMEPTSPPPGTVQCDDRCRCCLLSPSEELAERTIFTLQDACELKYLKAPMKEVTLAPTPPASPGTPAAPPPPPTFQDFINVAPGADAQQNPYQLELTEITIDGKRLHNWLHIRIFHNASTKNIFKKKDFGEGRIKMGFLMVSDAHGFPVGEFVNSIPCELSCRCEKNNTATEKVCYQGKREDAFPCMFDGPRVVSVIE